MDTKKPQIICHVEKSLNYTLFDCKWIPKTAKFVVVGSLPRGTGVIEVFEIASTDIKSVDRIDTAVSLKCCSFGISPTGRKLLACGDFNGNLEIWDLDTKEKTYEVKAHKEIINSLDAIGGNLANGPPEVVTGSRDGTVKVWDVRQKGKPVVVIEPEEGDQKRDCWTVSFGNSFNNVERVVCSAYDNGDIRLFDLHQSKVYWEKNLKNGICCVDFDRKDIAMNKLLVTTLESKFHVFDCRTLHPKKGLAGVSEKSHNSTTVWAGKHLPQNRDIFMTTGGDGGMCLWKYNYPSCRVKKDADSGLDMGVAGNVELLQNMTLATQPLSSIDWCPDKMGLAICTGFDQTLRMIIVTKLNQF